MIERVIAIGGDCCTGKSTLLSHVIGKPEDGMGFGPLLRNANHPHVAFHRPAHLERTLIVGDYEGRGLFGGTDSLDAGAPPQVCAWLETLHGQKSLFNEKGWAEGFVVIFEGDRLVTEATLERMKDAGLPVHLIMLTAPRKVLDARRLARGDERGKQWLAGRRSKAKKLLRLADQQWPNGGLLDLDSNAKMLGGFLR